MFAISKLPAPWRAAAVVCALQAGALSPGVRALEPPPDCQPADPRIFTDVAFNHPYCAWIEQLANHAISTGCAAGKYCPEAPVTRAQLAMLLERVMRGTDYWTSTPRIRFGCADPDSDCVEPENNPVSVNVFLDDPVYSGAEHLVRIWVSETSTFGTVGSEPFPLISYATQFPSATANVYQRVIGGSNSMNVMLMMNTAGTRYLMVEIGGRIFVSPAITWGLGPT
jgi:hypothetical protein